MKKDVIYIDVEDDLTAIIEKIKGADSSIIALVPPRRLGVLQSVVNLKLLKRAADEANKKAVLITSDQSLISLTAGIGLPVARNLQSRPEIIPESNDDPNEPDVIEGEMPTDVTDKTKEDEDIITPDEAEASAATASNSPASPAKPKKAKSSGKGGKKFKVPNFDNFRKRIFFIVGGVALLIVFLVWAIFFAPKATIVIRAQTDKKEGKIPVVIDSDAAGTNVSEKTLKGQLHQDTRNLTQTFTPTGKKEIGDKAKGSITIRNCDYSDGFTLQSGAQFTAASGQTFTSTQSVTVPKFSGSASSCSTSGSSAGTATVPVQASAIGEEYNIAGQNYSLPGISGKVDAMGTTMSGGSKKNVTVVTQEDVDKAKAQALAQDNKSIKSDLIKQFDKNTRAIEETFKAKQGQVATQPGVDQEASGQATLTIPMTYTVLGVANNDISNLLSNYFEDKIDDKKEQRVYDNGYKKLKITIDKDAASAQKVSATFETNGYLGPNIDTTKLASQIVGKRHGDIENIVKPVPGVETVDSHFSPFWVTKAPKADKITIKLEVANAE